MKIERSKEWWMRQAASGSEYVITASAPPSDCQVRRDAVFRAAVEFDHRYDGAAPESQGITRAVYIGHAVIAALYADQ